MKPPGKQLQKRRLLKIGKKQEKRYKRPPKQRRRRRRRKKKKETPMDEEEDEEEGVEEGVEEDVDGGEDFLTGFALHQMTFLKTTFHKTTIRWTTIRRTTFRRTTTMRMNHSIKRPHHAHRRPSGPCRLCLFMSIFAPLEKRTQMGSKHPPILHPKEGASGLLLLKRCA
jgi:hypothetical protein